MKSSYIVIIFLIILAGGGLLFFGMGNKVEAPVTDTVAPSPAPTPVLIPTPVPVPTPVSTGVFKDFTISGQNFSFTPSTITVNKGDNVRITFKNTSGFHNFVIDEFGVATTQAQSPNQEVIEFTADKVGSFKYYCSVGMHRAMGMEGTLVVK